MDRFTGAQQAEFASLKAGQRTSAGPLPAININNELIVAAEEIKHQE